jgi:hypothetical protein
MRIKRLEAAIRMHPIIAHLNRRTRYSLSVNIVPLLGMLSVLCVPIAARAQSQSSSASSWATEDQTDRLSASSYNDGDFTRPERSATTRFEIRKSSNATSSTRRGIEILQYNSRLDLNAGWKLGSQIQVPFIEKSMTTFGQPGTEGAAGLSNALVQAALIHSLGERWAYGFGARLVAPTATDSVNVHLWQIMPAAGVRYSFLEAGPDTYFVPVVRYAISFGGSPTARVIREPQIAPTLNIGLPDRWFVTLYPSNDIRINFGTPISGQTGRLFLPFDAAIGKKLTDDFILSLEGSVPIIKDYPVYDFKTELKATLQF